MNDNVDILDLLNKISDMVTSSRKVPFTEDLYMVNREALEAAIGDIRANFPRELKQARDIVKNQKDYKAQAEAEIAEKMEKAKRQVQSLISRESIVRQAHEKEREVLELAKEKAMGILSKAQTEASEIIHNARMKTEANYARLNQVLEQSRDDLRAAWTEFKKN